MSPENPLVLLNSLLAKLCQRAFKRHDEVVEKALAFVLLQPFPTAYIKLVWTPFTRDAEVGRVIIAGSIHDLYQLESLDCFDGPPEPEDPEATIKLSLAFTERQKTIFGNRSYPYCDTGRIDVTIYSLDGRLTGPVRCYFQMALEWQNHTLSLFLALKRKSSLLGELVRRYDGAPLEEQTLAQWLSEAAEKVRRASTFAMPSLERLLEREYVSPAVQELLGVGSGVRPLATTEEKRSLMELVSATDALARCLSAPALQDQAGILRAIYAPADVLSEPTVRRSGSQLDRLLPHLKDWTALSILLRACQEDAQKLDRAAVTAAARAFGQCLQETVPFLRTQVGEELDQGARRWSASVVGDRPRPGHANEPASGRSAPPESTGNPDDRNWFRLWFCLLLAQSLAQSEPEDAHPSRSTIRLYTDFAYVMRECLRMRIYATHAGYKFQPTAFQRALIGLVAYHAEHVVGLDGCLDIAVYLRGLASTSKLDDYHLAAGHIQHVIEIYIAGHFFLDLELQWPEGPSDTWRMEHLLARGGVKGTGGAPEPHSRPSEAAVRRLRQAFSLAALFHDAGLTVLPMYAWPTPRPSVPVPGVEAVFAEAGRVHREAMRTLVKTCIDTLANEGYVNLADEEALRVWLNAQPDSTFPPHDVLGAWYLHQRARDVPEAQRPAVREAVRAVLLHRATTVPVQMVLDPVAALLVLCDEAFDWEPFLYTGLSGDPISRSPSSFVADLHPYQSRMARIMLDDLVVESDGARLKVGVKASDGCFPSIRLMLEPPDRLDIGPHLTWLSTAQNLGRLCAGGAGWSPRLTMHMALPAWRRSPDLGTWGVLDEVAQRTTSPIRSYIERWLAGEGRFNFSERPSGPHWEAVCFEPLDPLFCPRDVREVFDALEPLMQEALREMERGALLRSAVVRANGARPDDGG